MTPDGDVMRIGHVTFHIGVGAKGMPGWTLADAPTVEPDVHPNGSTLLDHIVGDVVRSKAARG